MRPATRFLSLLLLAAAVPAGAAERSVDLNTAEVPLEAANEVPWETGEAEEGEDGASEEITEAKRRSRLIRLALGRVLVRFTGARQVTSDPLVRARLLERADDYVERYQYLSSSEQEPARLRARFSRPAVWQALQETGWPVWGSPRPTMLAWVAVRSGSGWRLASPDGYPELFRKLTRTAEARGLPLVLPLLDGTDRQELSASDLLFQDWGRIHAASQRYEPDAVLALRVVPARSGEAGRIHWSVRYGDLSAAFTTEKGQPGAGWVAGGIHQLVAFWSHRFAIYPGEESRLEVVVEGVESLARYAAVERALDDPSSVEGVTPVALRPGSARFRLRFQGRRAGLERALALNGALAPLDGSARGGQRVLRFTYRP